jgi:polysaccharide biosynthesis protein PelA
MTRTRKIFCCLLMLFLVSPCFALDDKTRAAFYYGEHPPLEELHAYNIVVVHADNAFSPAQYDNPSSQLYAYVSAGEMNADESYAKQADASWRVGKNGRGTGSIMDLSNPQWRNFLLSQVITPLWDKGYHGFYLDNLDAYKSLNLSPQKKQEQLAGITDFVKKIKEKYPDARILINGGFEALDTLHQVIEAVVAPSLFSGKNYQSIPVSKRLALQEELKKIHQQYQLPIIVIEYLPPNKRGEARKIAKQITQLGFIPWVSDSSLTTLGVGTIEIIPRKILLLFDKLPEDVNSSSIPVFDYTAFVLEYMGFIPVLQYVDETLYNRKLNESYAGVITWFSLPVIKNHALLEKWLGTQINQGVPIVFMQNFGFAKESSLMRSLGVNFIPTTTDVKSVKISQQDKMIGYEILPHPLAINFYALKTKGKVLLQLTASNDQQQDSIAITSWGGYAMEPFDIVTMPNGQSRWIVNPFEFFKQSLRLPTIPIPDVTTENGRRILLAQIDGDAFISRVTWKQDKYAGEVILEDILEYYKVPTTVSVVQKEFEIIKDNPTLEKRLIKAAQVMFALPWIEMATHTYSHPLKWWPLLENQLNTSYLSYPDDNYKFSYKKEIAGSANFINETFSPADKKVKLLLWSGDANVQERALQVAHEAGLGNINGKSKITLYSNKSINNMGPLGMMVGNYYHIFSPVSNEYEYTKNWEAPLYAFDKVISTFEITESPHRYKPILIYYHFYTATDQAALRALNRVYEWAEKQYVIPLFVSDYVDKVLGFNSTIIAKYVDGSWLITNNGNLREFRWPIEKGFPELGTSKNVVGFNTVNNELYIHLGSGGDSRFSFTKTKPNQPYLEDANARVTQWDVSDKTTKFTLQGYVPLRFKLANMKNCKLQLNNQIIPHTSDNSYYLEGINNGTFEIQCVR